MYVSVGLIQSVPRSVWHVLMLAAIMRKTSSSSDIIRGQLLEKMRYETNSFPLQAETMAALLVKVCKAIDHMATNRW